MLQLGGIAPRSIRYRCRQRLLRVMPVPVMAVPVMGGALAAARAGGKGPPPRSRPPRLSRFRRPRPPPSPRRRSSLLPPALDPAALLLGVVAEKTGYPVEMLTLDMELEAGLGIDSIKRVQILSALQEKLPQLADVDTNALAALNTLGEIVALASRMDGPAIVPAPASPDVDATALLLEVVAEKTGYPVEMLTLDMELEAGLGIDSIKRVQILSALQEKLPQLADVDTNAPRCPEYAGRDRRAGRGRRPRRRSPSEGRGRPKSPSRASSNGASSSGPTAPPRAC